jgi:hypothetical protein
MPTEEERYFARLNYEHEVTKKKRREINELQETIERLEKASDGREDLLTWEDKELFDGFKTYGHVIEGLKDKQKKLEGELDEL